MRHIIPLLWTNGVRRVRSSRARLTLAALLVLCPLLFARGGAYVSWKDLPRGVRAAKAKYSSQVSKINAAHAKAVKAADKTRLDAMAQARKPLDAAIDNAIDTAMDKKNLDLGSALMLARKSVAAKRPAKQIVIGRWNAEWANGRRGIITFKRDGTCHAEGKAGKKTWDAKGRWRITDTHVIAEWDDKLPGGDPAWDALRLPLTTDAVVIGDTWYGIKTLKVKRVK